MGTSSAAQAGQFAYLTPCLRCGADNGITAEVCWRCEAPLAARSPGGLELRTAHERADEHDQAIASQDTRRNAEAEPSFFPVLREEVPGEPGAANDAPGSWSPDDAPFAQDAPARPLLRSRGWVVLGAGLMLATILLGHYVVDSTAPPVREAPRLASTVPRDAVPLQAAFATAAPNHTTTAPAESCTAAVVALGLCGN
jgi:hypothetical protein